MASWWPITLKEAGDRCCDKCGRSDGLLRDGRNRIYCWQHRDLHDNG
jgi:hypothetical protein